MFSPSAASVSYGETLERSLKNTAAERLPVREVVQSLDPLITPILNPFVEGLQAPFSKVRGDAPWASALPRRHTT